MNIPIIIICYNNYKYVENTMTQILKINKKYYDNIIILNNASTSLDTIEFLKNTDITIIENENNGPWVSPLKNTHIYDALPDKYVLTDPDLQFNENLPNNFIEILSELSDNYESGKVGFALDISERDKMYEGIYAFGKTIYEWETQFWECPLYDSNYEIYVGGIDTTFALVNKKYAERQLDLRVAGIFMAKHLPWYKCDENINLVYNVYENYEIYNKTTEASTTKKLILSFIEKNYTKICKKDELFLFKKSDPCLPFCNDDILDQFLRKDKVFIDIGGSATLYGSRKSKHVYLVDNRIANMHTYLQTNCVKNYTLINNTESIYQIDPCNISLIYVDECGESMLDELFAIHNVPLVFKNNIYLQIRN